MRPAKDILFDFIRSKRDVNWDINLLEVYNKYANYYGIDKSKFIPEIPIVAEIKEEHLTESELKKEKEKKDEKEGKPKKEDKPKDKEDKEDKEDEAEAQSLADLKVAILAQNRIDIEKNTKALQTAEINKRIYLNILLVGQLDEAIYWLAAALPVKNIVIFCDIRDITPTFNYVLAELQKRNLPITMVYRPEKILVLDEYDVVFKGLSRVPVKVLADETIQL